ncbi:hypothetical protein LSTR_LSTR010324 [Laodelphax striatellus]|uniref:Regulatory protein zeste n=1 Tax=Laodelphax striatellus TaxID=195883 RepID=A0A482X1J5_LAOST|nr:hypothetical protein LSTR_LSTR010324 [Laodelphax striatellus]
MSEARKNRGTNFTSRERHLLVRLVSGRTEVIENKKTDNVSIRRKEIAWMEVAEEFNGHAAVSVRTVKQLRNCYENSKRRLKKKMLEDKIDFHSVNVDGEIPSNLDIETDNQLMSIMREQADPLHMVCENESSNQDDPAPANNDSEEEDDEMDSEIMESSTLTNRNDDVIILNNIEPIVTIAGGEEESEPSPSHAGGKWRERNRQHLRRLKYLKAAKSRDNMASLINERRSVLQEELQMLREKHAEEMLILKMKKENEEQMVREKHAEEMYILKMKKENEEKMLREKHAEEMLILKMKKENEQQMLREKHAEEMLILKMKKENELLRKKALESQIESYKTDRV